MLHKTKKNYVEWKYINKVIMASNFSPTESIETVKH